jgi:hypothetical protein
MKIIHILKHIESIDSDIKDLKKLEKSLQKDKSFTNPIYMSIEKQINILLGERIKLLELEIKNPPAHLVQKIEGNEHVPKLQTSKSSNKSAKPKTKTTKAKTGAKKKKSKSDDFDENTPIEMLTQDKIDARFNSLQESVKPTQSKPEPEKNTPPASETKQSDESDEDVKLLDIALEKGTLTKDEIHKEKKRVRFFKDNFPGGEY